MLLLFKKFILLVLISILVTPWVCDLLILYAGELPWPFARVFNRVILAVLIGFFIHAFIKNRKNYNRQNFKLDLSISSSLKFLFFFLIAAGTTIGVLPWIFQTSDLMYEPRTLAYLIERVPKIIIAALIIALIEENFFRKFMFDQFKNNWSIRLSFIFTNLIYAVLHFLKPDKSFDYQQHWYEGFNYIYAMLSRSVDLSAIKAMIALFMVGLILSYARSATNSIFISISLHMGWIFGIKFARYTSMLPANMDYPIGSGREYYLLTFYQAWLAILFVGICTYLILPKCFVGNQSRSVT